MPTLHELLQPQVILRVVSRIKKHQSRFSKWLGFQPTRFDPATVQISGPNTINGYGREFSYRIFDATRTIGTFVPPGRGPATTWQQPIGVVQGSYARVHEKMILDYESLGNLSPIIGPNSQVDEGGQNFIAKQTDVMAQKANNAISFMAAGLARGAFWLTQSGDNWLPSFTAPAGGVPFSKIDYRVPAGNTLQLNMLGAGSIIDVKWSNPAATIVKHLMAIKSAFTQLSGYMMEHVWINSNVWYMLITNTEIRNTAGTAATPYAEYEYVPETDEDGNKVSQFAARLKADPTITWHISDEGLVLGGVGDPSYSAGTGTFTKIFPDTSALFCPEVDNEWTEMGYGSEHVVEYPGPNQAINRVGYYFWHKYVDQPSGVELIYVMNGMPFLYIPKAIAPATVDF
jgi:hypothetical protein